MELMFFPCQCGMLRATEPVGVFHKIELGPCIKCGAPFRGVRLPLFGVWRLA